MRSRIFPRSSSIVDSPAPAPDAAALTVAATPRNRARVARRGLTSKSAAGARMTLKMARITPSDRAPRRRWRPRRLRRPRSIDENDGRSPRPPAARLRGPRHRLLAVACPRPAFAWPRELGAARRYVASVLSRPHRPAPLALPVLKPPEGTTPPRSKRERAAVFVTTRPRERDTFCVDAADRRLSVPRAGAARPATPGIGAADARTRAIGRRRRWRAARRMTRGFHRNADRRVLTPRSSIASGTPPS